MRYGPAGTHLLGVEIEKCRYTSSTGAERWPGPPTFCFLGFQVFRELKNISFLIKEYEVASDLSA